jgi:hypothetical protein
VHLLVIAEFSGQILRLAQDDSFFGKKRSCPLALGLSFDEAGDPCETLGETKVRMTKGVTQNGDGA